MQLPNFILESTSPFLSCCPELKTHLTAQEKQRARQLVRHFGGYKEFLEALKASNLSNDYDASISRVFSKGKQTRPCSMELRSFVNWNHMMFCTPFGAILITDVDICPEWYIGIIKLLILNDYEAALQLATITSNGGERGLPEPCDPIMWVKLDATIALLARFQNKFLQALEYYEQAAALAETHAPDLYVRYQTYAYSIQRECYAQDYKGNRLKNDEYIIKLEKILSKLEKLFNETIRPTCDEYKLMIKNIFYLTSQLNDEAHFAEYFTVARNSMILQQDHELRDIILYEMFDSSHDEDGDLDNARQFKVFLEFKKYLNEI